MALTATDRALLQRCLNREPGAWNDFVDRFIGLIYHVVQHTSHLRSAPLKAEDAEDLAADIFVKILENNLAVLRQFRGHCSLATYLTVIARRACIHEMARRSGAIDAGAVEMSNGTEEATEPKSGVNMESQDEVQALLRKLPPRERDVVRLFYLEGRSYEEIGSELSIPVNSIGPILTRARQKMRKNPKGSSPA